MDLSGVVAAKHGGDEIVGLWFGNTFVWPDPWQDIWSDAAGQFWDSVWHDAWTLIASEGV